jgi:hypothetical protein
MSYEREVSASEKFFIAYNELRPPFIIQLALELDGDPQPEALFDALERTTSVNPGSSLVLDQTREPPKWILGPPPTLTLVDAPDFEGFGGDEAPFFMWPLHAHEGPTCELLLVHGKSHNYLVFRALHAVMDGQGTLLWVKDFMRSLRGEAPLGHPSTLIADELIRSMKAKKRAPPGGDALHPFGRANLELPGDYRWRRVVVDRPLDADVSGRIAVALADQARTFGEGKVRINLPTDLRHYRPEERITANFFNSLFLEVAPNASAEMIGLKIVQMIYKNEGMKPVGVYANNEVGSLAIHRIRVMRDLAHLHDTGLYPFSATLSHLGHLKSAELSAPNASSRGAYFIPLVGDSGCVVTLNGFDERTEACVGLADRFTEGGGLLRLASLVETAIRGV